VKLKVELGRGGWAAGGQQTGCCGAESEAQVPENKTCYECEPFHLAILQGADNPRVERATPFHTSDGKQRVGVCVYWPIPEFKQKSKFGQGRGSAGTTLRTGKKALYAEDLRP